MKISKRSCKTEYLVLSLSLARSQVKFRKFPQHSFGRFSARASKSSFRCRAKLTFRQRVSAVRQHLSNSRGISDRSFVCRHFSRSRTIAGTWDECLIELPFPIDPPIDGFYRRRDAHALPSLANSAHCPSCGRGSELHRERSSFRIKHVPSNNSLSYFLTMGCYISYTRQRRAIVILVKF